jgi:hypothetical protein
MEVQKTLVRIGVGQEEATRGHFQQKSPAATSNRGSFNFLVTPDEMEFLGRLCKAIERSANGTQLLIVQTIIQPVQEQV